MRSAIAYTPRPGPLAAAGPVAASAYLLGFAVLTFVFSNPIVLAGLGLAVAVAGLAAGAGRALAASARWAAWLGVLVVIVNGIVSQRGATILVRGFEAPLLGRIDISGEALAEGGVLALRIAVVLAAFAVHSATVDPDRMLRVLRPLARHSAMTASLIARLVPLAAADLTRLREAAALRGPAAAPVARAAIARRLVAGSLDRATDVAAALELRGFARGAPRSPAPRRRSRHARRFGLTALIALAAGIGARAAGLGGFEAYPSIELGAGPATLALAASFPALAIVPFLGGGALGGGRRG